MTIFAVALTFCNYACYVTVLWLRYKPIISLIALGSLGIVLFCMFRLGESVPTDYARYKLGYF